MHLLYSLTTTLLFIFYVNVAVAQISIDTSENTVNASAILDISSQDRGLLTPRMSTSQRENIASPADGLLVYDTSEKAFYKYANSVWSQVAERPSSIIDGDGDTELGIDELSSGDQIVAEVLGKEPMLINSEIIYMNEDVFIGYEGASSQNELIENFELTGASAIVNNFDDWQSFTIPSNAILDYVQVYYLGDPPNGSVDFTFYEGEGDEGEALATVTLTDIEGDQSWNTISFASHNITLRKGMKYTLKFSRRWSLGLNSQDSYADGRAGSNDLRDYYFRVYGFKSNYTFSIEDGVISKGDYETETVDLENRVTATELILEDAEEQISILENLIPVGTIQMWPTSTPPTGWLICDGSSFNSTTYAELASLLGGSVLPNFNGRFPIGVGNSGTNGSTDHTLFSVGGFEEHLLTVDEMPDHNHEITYRSRSKDGSGSSVADLTGSGNTASTESTGGGQEHNNMPPYFTINYIIKASSN